MYAYSQDHGEYSPFDERGPLHSLALLYPKYIDEPKAFVCPSHLKRQPKDEAIREFPLGSSLAGAQCSYGYTWRVDPVAPSNFAIASDMPLNHEHKEFGVIGYNVLYVDGRIRWQQDPYCSYAEADNIFAPEPGWVPDTDSWIRQE